MAGGGNAHDEPNLVPLLDLVLQLVMFFMMCANFVMEQVDQTIMLPVAQSAKPMTDAKNRDVVFLNINTDENRDLVKPFLERNKWNKTIYFEDGLSVSLRVSSIPTTFIVNRRGEIASRMNGFVAEKFVDMLSERIRQSLEEK